MPTVTEFITAIEGAGRRMAAVLDETDLDGAVPTCPEWRVRDLVQHLGGVHRWATVFVTEGRMAPIERDLHELVGGWPADEQLLGWFASGYRRLCEALLAAPVDLECWTFLDAPSPLVHWARRQAHETAIHRVDAEYAAGAPVETFSAELATDGLDELLTAFITRPDRGPRSGVPRSLAISCSDTAGAWTVHYDSDSSRTSRKTEPADVTVGGPASDLYRWVWNRLERDGVDIQGDGDAADGWRSTVHVRW